MCRLLRRELDTVVQFMVTAEDLRDYQARPHYGE